MNYFLSQPNIDFVAGLDRFRFSWEEIGIMDSPLFTDFRRIQRK